MSRLLRWIGVVLGIGVAAVWSSSVRLPGGYLISPVLVTTEVEHNVLLMPVTGREYRLISEPGASWVVPFSRVITLDRRLQLLNADPVKVVISGGENLLMDYYVAWRIVDPAAFIRNFPRTQTDLITGMRTARDRIQESVKGVVGETIARLDLEQLLARNEALDRLAKQANREVQETGVSIVDVQISRTELPPNSLEAAYRQMREQQRAIARETRVRGERLARVARAAANKEARATLAEAHAFADRTRGAGDAGAARTYAAAYNRDPEFYAFVRSLEAYRKAIDDRTTLVVRPGHDFFRFFGVDGSP